MNERYARLIGLFFAIVPWSIVPLRSLDFATTEPIASQIILGYAVLLVLGAAVVSICFAFAERRDFAAKLLLIINCVYGVFGLLVLAQLLI